MNGEFLVFMEAEDSAAGLVKVATREKVYTKLAGKVKLHYTVECLNFIFSTKDFAYF